MPQTLSINITGSKVSESLEGLEYEAPATVTEWIERWNEDTLINCAVRQLKSDIQNGGRARLNNGKSTADEVRKFIAEFAPGVKAVSSARRKDPVSGLLAALQSGTLDAAKIAAMPPEAIAALQQKLAEAQRAQRKG